MFPFRVIPPPSYPVLITTAKSVRIVNGKINQISEFEKVMFNSPRARVTFLIAMRSLHKWGFFLLIFVAFRVVVVEALDAFSGTLPTLDM